MPERFARRIARLASDRASGAAAILTDAIGILQDAIDSGVDRRPIASALCRAQPAMAPVWRACLEALASRDRPERWTRFVQRAGRAPQALTRLAVECVEPAGTVRSDALHVVTLSYSGSVFAALAALAAKGPLRVSCSESRPGLEGRRLAAALTDHGVAVSIYTDAGLGEALETAHAVLVGADAVTPDGFVNKCGTRFLAAAASCRGCPFYLLASRDKFAWRRLAARLRLLAGPADDVWDAPPSGVSVCNPLFERTALELVSLVVTESAVLGADLVPALCDGLEAEIPAEVFEELIRET